MYFIKVNNVASSKLNYPSTFQNAKYYPWFIISLCSTLLFYKYILNVSPSSMTDQLMHDFKVNATGLGYIGAGFYYTYTITQLIVGFLLDRYSTRLLASASVFISALGALSLALSHSFTIALLARGLMGFGAAFATVTYLKVATIWFRSDRLAFVSGLLATAVMIGAICGVAPVAYFVKEWGWRETMGIITVFGFFIGFVLLIFMRDAPESHNHQNNSLTIKHLITYQDVMGILRNSQNWLLVCYSGLAFVPLIIMGGLWGNPFLRTVYSISSTEVGSLIGLIFIGFGVGGPVFGLLSDYLARRRLVMLIGLLLSLVSLTFIIYLTLPMWLLGLFLFLFGTGVGAFMLVFTVGRELNPLRLAAIVIGMINTGEFLSAFTEPMVGKLLDLQWDGSIVNGIHFFTIGDYRAALTLLIMYLLAAIIVLFFIAEPQRNKIQA